MANYRRDLSPELIKQVRSKAKFDPNTGIVRKMSQKEFGAWCGVHRVTVARWECLTNPLYPKPLAAKRIYDMMQLIQEREAGKNKRKPAFNLMQEVSYGGANAQ